MHLLPWIGLLVLSRNALGQLSSDSSKNPYGNLLKDVSGDKGRDRRAIQYYGSNMYKSGFPKYESGSSFDPEVDMDVLLSNYNPHESRKKITHHNTHEVYPLGKQTKHLDELSKKFKTKQRPKEERESIASDDEETTEAPSFAYSLYEKFKNLFISATPDDETEEGEIEDDQPEDDSNTEESDYPEVIMNREYIPINSRFVASKNQNPMSNLLGNNAWLNTINKNMFGQAEDKPDESGSLQDNFSGLFSKNPIIGPGLFGSQNILEKGPIKYSNNLKIDENEQAAPSEVDQTVLETKEIEDNFEEDSSILPDEEQEEAETIVDQENNSSLENTENLNQISEQEEIINEDSNVLPADEEKDSLVNESLNDLPLAAKDSSLTGEIPVLDKSVSEDFILSPSTDDQNQDLEPLEELDDQTKAIVDEGASNQDEANSIPLEVSYQEHNDKNLSISNLNDAEEIKLFESEEDGWESDEYSKEEYEDDNYLVEESTTETNNQLLDEELDDMSTGTHQEEIESEPIEVSDQELTADVDNDQFINEQIKEENEMESESFNAENMPLDEVHLSEEELIFNDYETPDESLAVIQPEIVDEVSDQDQVNLNEPVEDSYVPVDEEAINEPDALDDVTLQEEEQPENEVNEDLSLQAAEQLEESLDNLVNESNDQYLVSDAELEPDEISNEEQQSPDDLYPEEIEQTEDGSDDPYLINDTVVEQEEIELEPDDIFNEDQQSPDDIYPAETELTEDGSDDQYLINDTEVEQEEIELEPGETSNQEQQGPDDLNPAEIEQIEDGLNDQYLVNDTEMEQEEIELKPDEISIQEQQSPDDIYPAETELTEDGLDDQNLVNDTEVGQEEIELEPDEISNQEQQDPDNLYPVETEQTEDNLINDNVEMAQEPEVVELETNQLPIESYPSDNQYEFQEDSNLPINKEPYDEESTDPSLVDESIVEPEDSELDQKQENLAVNDEIKDQLMDQPELPTQELDSNKLAIDSYVPANQPVKEIVENIMESNPTDDVDDLVVEEDVEFAEPVQTVDQDKQMQNNPIEDSSLDEQPVAEDELYHENPNQDQETVENPILEHEQDDSMLNEEAPITEENVPDFIDVSNPEDPVIDILDTNLQNQDQETIENPLLENQQDDSMLNEEAPIIEETAPDSIDNPNPEDPVVDNLDIPAIDHTIIEPVIGDINQEEQELIDSDLPLDDPLAETNLTDQTLLNEPIIEPEETELENVNAEEHVQPDLIEETYLPDYEQSAEDILELDDTLPENSDQDIVDSVNTFEHPLAEELADETGVTPIENPANENLPESDELDDDLIKDQTNEPQAPELPESVKLRNDYDNLDSSSYEYYSCEESDELNSAEYPDLTEDNLNKGSDNVDNLNIAQPNLETDLPNVSLEAEEALEDVAGGIEELVIAARELIEDVTESNEFLDESEEYAEEPLYESDEYEDCSYEDSDDEPESFNQDPDQNGLPIEGPEEVNEDLDSNVSPIEGSEDSQGDSIADSPLNKNPEDVNTDFDLNSSLEDPNISNQDIKPNVSPIVGPEETNQDFDSNGLPIENSKDSFLDQDASPIEGLENVDPNVDPNGLTIQHPVEENQLPDQNGLPSENLENVDQNVDPNGLPLESAVEDNLPLNQNDLPNENLEAINENTDPNILPIEHPVEDNQQLSQNNLPNENLKALDENIEPNGLPIEHPLEENQDIDQNNLPNENLEVVDHNIEPNDLPIEHPLEDNQDVDQNDLPNENLEIVDQNMNQYQPIEHPVEIIEQTNQSDSPPENLEDVNQNDDPNGLLNEEPVQTNQELDPIIEEPVEVNQELNQNDLAPEAIHEVDQNADPNSLIIEEPVEIVQDVDQNISLIENLEGTDQNVDPSGLLIENPVEVNQQLDQNDLPTDNFEDINANAIPNDLTIEAVPEEANQELDENHAPAEIIEDVNQEKPIIDLPIEESENANQDLPIDDSKDISQDHNLNPIVTPEQAQENSLPNNLGAFNLGNFASGFPSLNPEAFMPNGFAGIIPNGFADFNPKSILPEEKKPIEQMRYESDSSDDSEECSGESYEDYSEENSLEDLQPEAKEYTDQIAEEVTEKPILKIALREFSESTPKPDKKQLIESTTKVGTVARKIIIDPTGSVTIDSDETTDIVILSGEVTDEGNEKTEDSEDSEPSKDSEDSKHSEESEDSKSKDQTDKKEPRNDESKKPKEGEKDESEDFERNDPIVIDFGQQEIGNYSEEQNEDEYEYMDDDDLFLDQYYNMNNEDTNYENQEDEGTVEYYDDYEYEEGDDNQNISALYKHHKYLDESEFANAFKAQQYLEQQRKKGQEPEPVGGVPVELIEELKQEHDKFNNNPNQNEPLNPDAEYIDNQWPAEDPEDYQYEVELLSSFEPVEDFNSIEGELLTDNIDKFEEPDKNTVNLSLDQINPAPPLEVQEENEPESWYEDRKPIQNLPYPREQEKNQEVVCTQSIFNLNAPLIPPTEQNYISSLSLLENMPHSGSLLEMSPRRGFTTKTISIRPQNDKMLFKYSIYGEAQAYVFKSRELIYVNNELSWSQASLFCHYKFAGHLVEVNTEGLLLLVRTIIQNQLGSKGKVWVNGRYEKNWTVLKNGKERSPASESIMQFVANASVPESYCLAAFSHEEATYLTKHYCLDEHQFICERPRVKDKLSDWIELNDYFYKVIDGKFTIDEAKQKCIDIDPRSTLALVLDTETMLHLTEVMSYLYIPKAWVDGEYVPNIGWTFTSTSSVMYEVPGLIQKDPENENSCIVLADDPSYETGALKQKDCRKRYGAICSKLKNKKIKVDFNCGYRRYELFTGKYYWRDANKFCELKRQGKLAEPKANPELACIFKGLVAALPEFNVWLGIKNWQFSNGDLANFPGCPIANNDAPSNKTDVEEISDVCVSISTTEKDKGDFQLVQNNCNDNTLYFLCEFDLA